MVGDCESEIEMADRAVALNPNSLTAWQARGWVYRSARLLEEAVRSFERVIRMKRLALAFVIAGVSDVIDASLSPPIGWAVDVGTAALLFVVLLGWQWLLLPGLVLEAISGVGVLPFWLLVVGAIAVIATPRPKIGQR
jgi:tetratricopeptide (TPR) repeat protein